MAFKEKTFWTMASLLFLAMVGLCAIPVSIASPRIRPIPLSLLGGMGNYRRLMRIGRGIGIPPFRVSASGGFLGRTGGLSLVSQLLSFRRRDRFLPLSARLQRLSLVSPRFRSGLVRQPFFPTRRLAFVGGPSFAEGRRPLFRVPLARFDATPSLIPTPRRPIRFFERDLDQGGSLGVGVLATTGSLRGARNPGAVFAGVEPPVARFETGSRIIAGGVGENLEPGIALVGTNVVSGVGESLDPDFALASTNVVSGVGENLDPVIALSGASVVSGVGEGLDPGIAFARSSVARLRGGSRLPTSGSSSSIPMCRGSVLRCIASPGGVLTNNDCSDGCMRRVCRPGCSCQCASGSRTGSTRSFNRAGFRSAFSGDSHSRGRHINVDTSAGSQAVIDTTGPGSSTGIQKMKQDTVDVTIDVIGSSGPDTAQTSSVSGVDVGPSSFDVGPNSVTSNFAGSNFDLSSQVSHSGFGLDGGNVLNDFSNTNLAGSNFDINNLGGNLGLDFSSNNFADSNLNLNNLNVDGNVIVDNAKSGNVNNLGFDQGAPLNTGLFDNTNNLGNVFGDPGNSVPSGPDPFGAISAGLGNLDLSNSLDVLNNLNMLNNFNGGGNFDPGNNVDMGGNFNSGSNFDFGSNQNVGSNFDMGNPSDFGTNLGSNANFGNNVNDFGNNLGLDLGSSALDLSTNLGGANQWNVGSQSLADVNAGVDHFSSSNDFLSGNVGPRDIGPVSGGPQGFDSGLKSDAFFNSGNGGSGLDFGNFGSGGVDKFGALDSQNGLRNTGFNDNFQSDFGNSVNVGTSISGTGGQEISASVRASSGSGLNAHASVFNEVGTGSQGVDSNALSSAGSSSKLDLSRVFDQSGPSVDFKAIGEAGRTGNLQGLADNFFVDKNTNSNLGPEPLPSITPEWNPMDSKTNFAGNSGTDFGSSFSGGPDFSVGSVAATTDVGQDFAAASTVSGSMGPGPNGALQPGLDLAYSCLDRKQELWCEPTKTWDSTPGLRSWCNANCPVGQCDFERCSCGCVSPVEFDKKRQTLV